MAIEIDGITVPLAPCTTRAPTISQNPGAALTPAEAIAYFRDRSMQFRDVATQDHTNGAGEKRVVNGLRMAAFYDLAITTLGGQPAVGAPAPAAPEPGIPASPEPDIEDMLG